MEMTTVADDSATGRFEGAGLSDPDLSQRSAGRLPTGHEWFVLHLPRPPSVNRFVSKLGNISPAVAKWVKQCDRHMLGQNRPRLQGAFEISIRWDVDQFGRFDGDNRIKPLMDYLQRIEVIENDKWCRRYIIDWGPVVLGCQVCVRAWRKA